MLAKIVAVALLTLLGAAVAKQRLYVGMRGEILTAAKLLSHKETEDAVSDFFGLHVGMREEILAAAKPSSHNETEDAVSEFLDRVISNLPSAHSSDLNFKFWNFAGRPTNEGVGVLSIADIDVDMLAATIMNVGEYRGNIDYVAESRVVPDPNCNPPQSVHVYQRIKLPLLMPPLHGEILLKDFGERDGWRVLAWQLLDEETGRLNPRQAARLDYNVGAWLLKPDAIAFASSSAPRKSDVGTSAYAMLTKGADATAKTTLKANIKAMVAWSRRGVKLRLGHWRSWWERILGR